MIFPFQQKHGTPNPYPSDHTRNDPAEIEAFMTIILLLLGAALIYIIQAKLYAHHWKQGLYVSINFSKEAVVEGESATLVEEIINNKRLPLPILHVKFQIGRNLLFEGGENTAVSDLSYRHDIFSVLFYQKITRTLKFECSKRGFYSIDQANLVSSNLFLSGNLVDTQKQSAFLYVYPKEIDISKLDIPFQKAMGTLLSKQLLFEDPFEFRGIREYQITDPMNTINWKATAKTGNLMVNVHHSTRTPEAVILLDVQDETLWKYDHLHEVGIRIAATLSARFLVQSIPIRIICNGRDQLTKELIQVPVGNGKRQIAAINESLARIDLSLEPFSCLDQLNNEISEMSSNRPYYIYISSSFGQQRNNLMHQLADLSRGAMWIVIHEKDVNVPISSSDHLDIIKWEVDRNEI